MTDQSPSEVPQILAEILARRGVASDDIGAFLYPDYALHTHDPYLLIDMAAAVARIILASERSERVVIYGDYDIDGITASAIMLEALVQYGIEATSYIPDRFEEGYGINLEALQQLKASGVDLVISVDCGITSAKEAEWARDNGLDLIITDHHAVPAELPQAIAVINPKRPGDVYPFKELCGAGVAFKLVQALQQRTGVPAAGQEKWLLDLVALGTVCDVVELVGENRVLASYGLKVMRRTRRIGLRALANIGGVDIASINSHHLGFVLGPRLNAAGRLEHAARSLELLQTTDAERAASISEELDQLNRQRRSDQETIFTAADRQAEMRPDDAVLLLADTGWSHGIVGIVASKLAEKWQKPVLVAQTMGEVTKGSGRSIGNFNLVEALRANVPLLTKFGGHYYAAGFTLPTDRLDELRTALNTYHAEHADTYVRPELEADAELSGLETADWELLGQLSLLEPYGQGNREPLLSLTDLTLKDTRRIGKDQTHLKLTLADDGKATMGAIGFGLALTHPDLKAGQPVTVFAHLNKNEFRGESTLQLVVRDIRYE